MSMNGCCGGQFRIVESGVRNDLFVITPNGTNLQDVKLKKGKYFVGLPLKDTDGVYEPVTAEDDIITGICQVSGELEADDNFQIIVSGKLRLGAVEEALSKLDTPIIISDEDKFKANARKMGIILVRGIE